LLDLRHGGQLENDLSMQTLYKRHNACLTFYRLLFDLVVRHKTTIGVQKALHLENACSTEYFPKGTH